MRIDGKQPEEGSRLASGDPAPRQVLTPQVPHLGIGRSGRRGGCPGSPSGVEGWSPLWACLGPH